MRTGAAVEASSPGRPRKPGMRWGGVARSPKSGIERNSSQPQSTEQPSILPATVMHTTSAAVAAVVLVFAGQSPWLGRVVEGGGQEVKEQQLGAIHSPVLCGKLSNWSVSPAFLWKCLTFIPHNSWPRL